MIGIIGLLVACAIVTAVAPRLAAAITVLLIFGFIFPIVTVSFGGLLWALSTGAGFTFTFTGCCLYFGVPCAIGISLFILSN